MTRHHTKKKNKETETCPVKIERVEAEIQAYAHAHTHTRTHARTHARTHTSIQCYVGALIDRKKGEFEKQNDAILYFAFRIMY